MIFDKPYQNTVCSQFRIITYDQVRVSSVLARRTSLSHVLECPLLSHVFFFFLYFSSRVWHDGLFILPFSDRHYPCIPSSLSYGVPHAIKLSLQPHYFYRPSKGPMARKNFYVFLSSISDAREWSSPHIGRSAPGTYWIRHC